MDEKAGDKLDPEDADDLRHALGLNSKKRAYRNYYAADPGHLGMERLVAAGLMRRGRTISGGLVYHHVTEAGAAAIGAELPDDD